MFNDLFFCLFLSEPFYLSHTEGSYTDWGRGVAQERDSNPVVTLIQKLPSSRLLSPFAPEKFSGLILGPGKGQ